MFHCNRPAIVFEVFMKDTALKENCKYCWLSNWHIHPFKGSTPRVWINVFFLLLENLKGAKFEVCLIWRRFPAGFDFIFWKDLSASFENFLDFGFAFTLIFLSYLNFLCYLKKIIFFEKDLSYLKKICLDFGQLNGPCLFLWCFHLL